MFADRKHITELEENENSFKNLSEPSKSRRRSEVAKLQHNCVENSLMRLTHHNPNTPVNIPACLTTIKPIVSKLAPSNPQVLKNHQKFRLFFYQREILTLTQH